ncbi:hypothetical protein ATC03_02020 [Agromyces aureus]|uniref:Helix-turn-helix domain-containing protein n=2 Tax=Agromyces aureus TaxID=453304 RepID=A0A191WBT3_9MICO|nr:hypothetical protein ATC03_02020 [Agromyces aureus]
MDVKHLLLTPREVSEWTGLSMGALAQLRYKGLGPSFIKLTPKTVRYIPEQVEAWIEESVRTQTGQQ